MTRTTIRLLAALVLVAPACSDGTAPPEPGEVVVRLVSPNTGDAAAVLTLTAPSGVTIADFEPGSQELAVFHRTTGTTTRIAVFGPLDGAVARFTVPNVRDAGLYTVQLLEVADESNTLRTSLAGYSASVVRE
jgi:hypothetical protein